MGNTIYSYYKKKLGEKGFVLKDGMVHYLENCEYHAEAIKKYFYENYPSLEQDYLSFEQEVMDKKTMFSSYLSSRELRAIYLTYFSEITFLNTSSRYDVSGMLFVPEDWRSLSLSQQKKLEEFLTMFRKERWIEILVIPSYLNRMIEKMRSIPITEYRKDGFDGQANFNQIWRIDDQKTKQKTFYQSFK